MKNNLEVILCFILMGCNFQSEPNETESADREEKMQIEYVDLSAEHMGLWVSETYINTLKETRSTKIASGTGVDDFYRISEDHSILRTSIHEGGASNLLLMTSENKGLIFNSDTTKSYAAVEFHDNSLYVDGDVYTKAPDGKDGLNVLVNSTFIEGKYWLNETEIELKRDGTVLGLDSLKRFELNLDYLDAGMEYDKIYLFFNDEQRYRTYLYAFVSDTLIISKIDCKSEADEYDYCVEVAKGETLYKLVKK